MPGPLDGIRIIDLTTMASGPLATSILADQGADVIKVEGPGRGDGLRKIGPSRGGLSALFASLNRNKRSIVIDLREPRGVEILDRLVEANASIVAEHLVAESDRAIPLDDPWSNVRHKTYGGTVVTFARREPSPPSGDTG